MRMEGCYSSIIACICFCLLVGCCYQLFFVKMRKKLNEDEYDGNDHEEIVVADAESLMSSNNTNTLNMQRELLTVIDANAFINSSKVSSSSSSWPISITTKNNEDNHELLLLSNNTSNVDNNAASIIDSATLLLTQKDCYQLIEAEEQCVNQTAIIDALSNSDNEFAAPISAIIFISAVLLSLFHFNY